MTAIKHMAGTHWSALDDVPVFSGIAAQWPEHPAEPQILAL